MVTLYSVYRVTVYGNVSNTERREREREIFFVFRFCKEEEEEEHILL